MIHASQVDAVVTPINALGGPAVLAFLAQGVLIIAVQENATSMRVTAESLYPSSTPSDSNDNSIHSSSGNNMHSANKSGNIVIARSYAEAAGLLAAHKAGILLQSITSQVDPLSVTEL